MHVLRVTGFFVGGIALLALVGLVGDLFGKFEFTRSAPTWGIWIGGLILAGLFYAVSEGLFEWIAEPDQTTDPLAKRVWRLTMALLAIVGLILVAILVVTAIA